MATKPLKTITFEGLEDTYTIPQIDDTLSVTGASADAKATGDAISTKAEAEGAVSMAKALVGGKYTLDQSPYHYRQSPDAGSLDEKIVGGTLAWNQLCNSSSVIVQSGHKYLSKIGGTYSVGSSTGTAITGLTSGTDMVIDLTAMFGSTIADYIYSLEQSSAGAGVDWVRQYIDLDTYHEYCEPTLKSVEGLVSHDMVGFNLFDKSTASVGKYIKNDGTLGNLATTFVTDYIHVQPSVAYYCNHIVGSASLEQSYAEYDFDKNFIRVVLAGSGGSAGSGGKETILTTSDDVHYIRFIGAISVIDETNFNLSDPSRNGTYEPYEKHSYPLDSSVELRGIPKLSDGKMYFDGDWYQSDGQVTRRYGVVDMGTLNWALHTSYPNVFYTTGQVLEQNMKAKSINFITTKYPNAGTLYSSYDDVVNNAGSIMVSYSTIRLSVKDTAYSDASAFKTAMSGVMLVYELATPTTETAQPYQSPQLAGSTEEYVTTGVVPVGHESRYYEDITGKVNDLPSDFSTLIAPVEKSFTATRNYTVGSFVIVDNQLYKVTSAISSGGTITPNSNVTATTIMAEILALA